MVGWFVDWLLDLLLSGCSFMLHHSFVNGFICSMIHAKIDFWIEWQTGWLKVNCWLLAIWGEFPDATHITIDIRQLWEEDPAGRVSAWEAKLKWSKCHLKDLWSMWTICTCHSPGPLTRCKSKCVRLFESLIDSWAKVGMWPGMRTPSGQLRGVRPARRWWSTWWGWWSTTSMWMARSWCLVLCAPWHKEIRTWV